MRPGASSFCAGRAIAVALVGVVAISGCAANHVAEVEPPTAGSWSNASAEGTRDSTDGCAAAAIPLADAGAPEATVEANITSDASSAVRELADQLFHVEQACRDGAADESTLCEHRLFTDVATRYQRRWGHQSDPEQDRGRIDALPRLGGPERTVDQVVGLIVTMCSERCVVERRSSWGRRVSDVIDSCKSGTTPVARSCGAIKTLTGIPPNATVSDAVDRCVSECTDERKDAADGIAFEKRRPRTKAQSEKCLKTCMKSCDTSGWCGTCEMGCRADCAVAVP
jgi:hypothetical protein